MSLPVPHTVDGKTPVASHAWERQEHDWYVEGRWCSVRLFEEEKFVGGIHDPCCGSGRIVEAAMAAGIAAAGSDIKVRMAPEKVFVRDFFKLTQPLAANVVSNPPFNRIEEFARHACTITPLKVAMICPTQRLAAAWHWLQDLPLQRIWFLTPRPSMPPGHIALEYERLGKKPSGDKRDFCWLVFDRGYSGRAETRWLHRDKEKQR